MRKHGESIVRVPELGRLVGRQARQHNAGKFLEAVHDVAGHDAGGVAGSRGYFKDR